MKFRVWDKSINYMDDRVRVTTTDDYMKVEVLDWISDWRELKEGQYELMQSTGLFDKNGEEIFEGDIVEMHYFYMAASLEGCTECEDTIIGEIGIEKDEFYPYYVGLKTKNEIIELNNFDGLHELSFTILGNVYENTELLEVEE